MNEWIDIKERQPGVVPKHYNVTAQVGAGKPWVAMCFWDGAKFYIDAPSVVTAWWPREEGPVPGAPPVPKATALDGWISIEERLPPKNIICLIWDGCLRTFSTGRSSNTILGHRDITHWMLPPEPPSIPGPFEPRARDLCGRILHSVCYRGVRQWDVDTADWAQGECDKLNELWAQKGTKEEHHDDNTTTACCDNRSTAQNCSGGTD